MDEKTKILQDFNPSAKIEKISTSLWASWIQCWTPSLQCFIELSLSFHCFDSISDVAMLRDISTWLSLHKTSRGASCDLSSLRSSTIQRQGRFSGELESVCLRMKNRLHGATRAKLKFAKRYRAGMLFKC